MRPHRLHPVDSAADVVVEVRERLIATFANGLERSEMDDRIDAAFEGTTEVIPVADVALAETQRAACQFLRAFLRDRRAVAAAAVADSDFMARFDDTVVATDVAGAGHDDVP